MDSWNHGIRSFKLAILYSWSLNHLFRQLLLTIIDLRLFMRLNSRLLIITRNFSLLSQSLFRHSGARRWTDIICRVDVILLIGLIGLIVVRSHKTVLWLVLLLLWLLIVDLNMLSQVFLVLISRFKTTLTTFSVWLSSFRMIIVKEDPSQRLLSLSLILRLILRLSLCLRVLTIGLCLFHNTLILLGCLTLLKELSLVELILYGSLITRAWLKTVHGHLQIISPRSWMLLHHHIVVPVNLFYLLLSLPIYVIMIVEVLLWLLLLKALLIWIPRMRLNLLLVLSILRILVQKI